MSNLDLPAGGVSGDRPPQVICANQGEEHDHSAIHEGRRPRDSCVMTLQHYRQRILGQRDDDYKSKTLLAYPIDL